MSTSDRTHHTSARSPLDRPSELIPSIDRPWDNRDERAHRQTAIRGDRSEHRVYHALYEDLLN